MTASLTPGLASARVEAAFFDLDKTVISRASLLAFGARFFQEGLITRRTVARSLWAQLVYRYLGANERRLRRLERSVLHVTQGWQQSVVRRVVSEALTEIITPLVYREAVELMELHRLAGRKVYLISASPEEIVEPLATFLGVDGQIASRPKVDAEGVYTGEMEFYAYGPYKAEAMLRIATQEGIDLARSYAYSDSYTDLPMLEAVGHPVAVNPDRVLARVARERGWEVLEFRHHMKVGHRVLLRTLGAVAIGLGIAALPAAPLLRRLARRPLAHARSR
jgi:HAD superfamily hydrolase (TIGR01490 family)